MGLEKSFSQALEGEQFTIPTMTKTWFHQGPVGPEFGEWEEIDFSDEYWQEDPTKLEPFKKLREYTRFYDPLSRAIKTLNPDDTEQQVAGFRRIPIIN